MIRRLVGLLVLWLWPACVVAQITHGSVNVTAQVDGLGSTSITTPSISPGANHFLGVIVYSTSSTARVVASVTDSSSLCAVSWITQSSHANLKFSDALIGEIEIVYCYKTNANTGTLTFTWDSAISAGATLSLREYVGVQTTSDPFDSAPGGALQTGSPGPSMTLAAPAVSNSLALLGAAIFNGTDGMSWSNATLDLARDDATTGIAHTSADILTYSSSTTVGVSSTHTGSEVGMVGAVFKAAAGGGGTPGCKNGLLLAGAGCFDQ